MEKNNETLGSTIGDQLAAKGIEVKFVPIDEAANQEFTPSETTREIQKLIATPAEQPAPETAPRGGRRTQADSSKLGPAIENALKTNTPAEASVSPSDIEKAQKEKGKLLVDLADARVREKQVQGENLSQETRDVFTKSLLRIQKRIAELNRIIPNVDPFEDQAKVQKIIAEYDEKVNVMPTPTNENVHSLPALETPVEELTLVPQEIANPLAEDDKVKLSNLPELSAEEQKELETAEEALLVKIAAIEARIKEETAGGMLGGSPEQNSMLLEARKKIEEIGLQRSQSETQSPYDNAVDRIWKENEEKRNAAGLAGKGENLELEPIASEVPTTPDLETIPTPVGVEGPHLVSAENNESPFDAKMRKMYEHDPGKAERLLKTMGMQNEETQAKFKKVFNNIEKKEQENQDRAEKIGERDAFRKIGDLWNKVPTRYKYMLAAGMFLSGAGAAIPGYVLASRLLSGAGAFVGFETMFKNSYEKKHGEPRPEHLEARHTLYSGIIAFSLGALVPTLTQELLGLMTPEVSDATVHSGPYAEGKIHTATHPLSLPNEPAENQMNVDQKGLGMHTETPGVANSLSAEKLTELSTIKEGQGFWQPVHNQLAALHPDWTTEHLNHDTQELLMKNGIINADGSELQISKVGTHIVLNPDNTITYDHSAAYTAVPETEVTKAVSVPPAPSSDHASFSDPSHETPSAMPQEIAPTDPAIVTYSDKLVNDYANASFGSKGFLGFGAQSGVDSIDWKDPDVGFANHPVDKVLAAHPSAFPADGTRHFGVEDYSATQRMQEGLIEAQKDTGVSVRPGEKVVDYLRRAAITAFSEQQATATVTPTILRT